MRGKGYQGETCQEVIREVTASGKAMRYSEILGLVKARGNWTDDHIAQEMISYVVNLPPARVHWEKVQPFLFLNPDGTFEMYKAGTHPKVKG